MHNNNWPRSKIGIKYYYYHPMSQSCISIWSLLWPPISLNYPTLFWLLDHFGQLKPALTYFKITIISHNTWPNFGEFSLWRKITWSSCNVSLYLLVRYSWHMMVDHWTPPSTYTTTWVRCPLTNLSSSSARVTSNVT